MDDDDTTEGTETLEVQGDSAPFRDALARAEAAEAKVSVFEEEGRKAEVEAQQLRSDAMAEIVKSLGIPELQEDLLRWVDGPVTLETVEAALQAKGLNFVKTDVETPVVEEPQPTAVEPSTAVVNASTLGQQVADAASGATAAGLTAQLAEADKASDVIRLMDEAGATVSYI